MKSFFILTSIISILSLSFNLNKKVINQYPQDNSNCFSCLKYRIDKIDSIENIYLIYMSRHDSIFRIASKKNEVCDCERIKIGQFYSLIIKSVYPDNFNQKYDIAGTKFEDHIIEFITDSIVWDLFFTENLSGLCYNPIEFLNK